MGTPKHRSFMEDPNGQSAMYMVVLALVLVAFSIYWLLNAPTILDFEAHDLGERAQTLPEIVAAAKLRWIEMLKWFGVSIAVDLLGLACLWSSFRSFLRFAGSNWREPSEPPMPSS